MKIKNILILNIKDNLAKSLLFCFIISVIPLLEICSLSLLYVLISGKDSISLYFLKLDQLNQQKIILLIVLSLFLSITGKFIQEKISVHLRFKLYVKYALQMTESFLSLSFDDHDKLDKNKFAAAVITEGIVLGTVFFNILRLFQSIVSITIYFITMIFMSWKIVILGISIYLVPFILNRKRIEKQKAFGVDKMNSHAELINFVNDFVKGFYNIKIYEGKEFILKKAKCVYERSQKWRIGKFWNAIKMEVTIESCSNIGIVLIIILGKFFNVSTEILGGFIIIGSRIRSFVNQFQKNLIQLNHNEPVVKRITSYLQLPREQNVNSEKVFSLKIQNMSFKYEDDDWEGIRINEFSAASGDKIWIKGNSGTGKSTILKLICGIIVPNKGSYYLNGNEVKNLFPLIKEELAYISQEILLFDMSLLDNFFTLSEEEESSGKVKKSIDLAHLSNEVTIKNEDTIGDNGSNLSFGQKQRLLWSKLFLKRPGFIILDEATVHLDKDGERIIFDNLRKELGEDIIIIVVSHRKPEGISFNKEYLIEDGKLFLTE